MLPSFLIFYFNRLNHLDMKYFLIVFLVFVDVVIAAKNYTVSSMIWNVVMFFNRYFYQFQTQDDSNEEYNQIKIEDYNYEDDQFIYIYVDVESKSGSGINLRDFIWKRWKKSNTIQNQF